MSFIDFAGSKISHLLDFSLKAGKPIFRDELRSRLWKFVIRSIIKLVLIFATVLVAIFSPFGEWWSEYFVAQSGYVNVGIYLRRRYVFVSEHLL